VAENLARLFGSSGVRGLVNSELTPSLACMVGTALATSSGARRVLVARDTRVSGLMLENALISGILSAGADVEQCGVLPTPVLAYLTRETHADAGVMITASHNPSQYNGIKLFNGEGMAYDEESQNRVEDVVERRRFKRASWRDIGRSSFSDQTHLYMAKVAGEVKLRRRWYVMVDPGCGATYHVAPALLTRVGCTVKALNAQPDGHFPARIPEPNAQSVAGVAEVAKAFGVDAGFAYDGDGDRVAFIDEGGSFVDFDRAFSAYAAHVVKRSGGGVVVTNVEASMSVEKMVEAHGGSVVRVKVGDIHISRAVKQHDAVFGGEPCGAWIHPQFHLCPDGVLSSALLLKALEETEKRLSDFVSEAPQYPTVREKVECANEEKQELVQKSEEGLKQAFPEYRELSTIDGLRLRLEGGWVLVRASGTEPAVRITAEGESLKEAREIADTAVAVVKQLVRRA